LHHVIVDRWSQGNGPLHRRDPRAKAAVLLVFLVVVATTHRHLAPVATGWLAGLAVMVWWTGLPVLALLARAALVLPFSLAFAIVSWLAGDAERAIALLVKSYLSSAAVLLLVSTTPLPKLLHGLERMGVPQFLLTVGQFLFRYLFVISEEAQHMRTAAASRAASVSRILTNGSRFRAAGGALAVLFTRSFGRAEQIHQAMLSRGFEGHFQPLHQLRFGAGDMVFVLGAAPAPWLVRLAMEQVVR
jgi:cobalt/nickel transport system permease protein